MSLSPSLSVSLSLCLSLSDSLGGCGRSLIFSLQPICNGSTAAGVKIRGNGGDWIYALSFDEAYSEEAKGLSEDKEEQDRLRLEDLKRRTNTLQRTVDIHKLCRLYSVRCRSHISYVPAPVVTD
eukprot:COSAG03_NODE_269_length_9603_cov_225.864927_10_plen_124_part_00